MQLALARERRTLGRKEGRKGRVGRRGSASNTRRGIDVLRPTNNASYLGRQVNRCLGPSPRAPSRPPNSLPREARSLREITTRVFLLFFRWFQRIFEFFTFVDLVVVDNVLSFDVIDKFDKFGIIYLIVSNICNGRKGRLQYEGKKRVFKALGD